MKAFSSLNFKVLNKIKRLKDFINVNQHYNKTKTKTLRIKNINKNLRKILNIRRVKLNKQKRIK